MVFNGQLTNTVFIYGQQYEYDLSACMDVDLPFKKDLQVLPKGPFKHMSLVFEDVGGKLVFKDFLGGGFKYFLFSPLFGEDSQFD